MRSECLRLIAGGAARLCRWSVPGAVGLSLAGLLAGALLLGAPSTARAEDAAEELPDKFMIRGGWNYVFNADTTFAINGASGINSSVDFAKTLGGQREDHLWRIDAQYRFNPRHSVGFSYYDVKRRGTRLLNDSITIGDVTYSAGGAINSQLDIGLYRFFYNWSFHRDEKVELGLSAGMYFADIRFSFNSNLTCTSTTGSCTGATPPGGGADKILAPLPQLGFLVNYNINPKLKVMGRFDWFYLETSAFQGSMTEMYLGLEYRLFKHLGLGAAYNRLDINADYNPDKSTGWSLKNDWNTLFMYGALYF